MLTGSCCTSRYGHFEPGWQCRYVCLLVKLIWVSTALLENKKPMLLWLSLLLSMLPSLLVVVLAGTSLSPCSHPLSVLRDQCETVLCRDAFCLFWDAKSKSVKALNGSGPSPERLTIEHVWGQGITGRTIPLTNLNAVTVPGLCP